ncbi:MAG TPA: hypothetical protein VM869_00635, partial [Enhygromyxa sp.]|nr:hypothetical protein [Enhygromyxa sp.]
MHRVYIRLPLAACVLLVACSDDGGGSEAAEAGETNGDGDGDGDGLPDAAPGWESAFVDDGVAFDCDAPEADLIAAGVPSVSVGETTLYIGAEQNNQAEQDAAFARFDGGVQTYCVHHENEGPNGIGLGLVVLLGADVERGLADADRGHARGDQVGFGRVAV